VLVKPPAAKQVDLDIGSNVTNKSATEFEDEAPQDGPNVDATVVGIGGDGIMDLLSEGTDSPGFLPSVAFLEEHGDVVPHWSNLVVRLRPGTDVREFDPHVVEVMGLPDVPVLRTE